MWEHPKHLEWGKLLMAIFAGNLLQSTLWPQFTIISCAEGSHPHSKLRSLIRLNVQFLAIHIHVQIWLF